MSCIEGPLGHVTYHKRRICLCHKPSKTLSQVFVQVDLPKELETILEEHVSLLPYISRLISRIISLYIESTQPHIRHHSIKHLNQEKSGRSLGEEVSHQKKKGGEVEIIQISFGQIPFTRARNSRVIYCRRSQGQYIHSRDQIKEENKILIKPNCRRKYLYSSKGNQGTKFG